VSPRNAAHPARASAVNGPLSYRAITAPASSMACVRAAEKGEPVFRL